ncbi:hypothetical protein JCM8097_003963 [Rhodosporidiobolus ruineniae]
MRLLATRFFLASLATSVVALPPQGAQTPFFPPWPHHRQQPARGEYRMEPGYNPYDGGTNAPELRTPAGFSRNIPERRIHSHNDYWRDVPVYTALSHGVLSIEADVWLNPKDGVLYVSHNVAALTRARTFQRLYVDQLVDVLERANPHDDDAKGLFAETDYWSPENEREVRRPWTSFYEGNLTPIQLLVDLKTRGNETYHALLHELAPLRERPIQVLITGNGINLDVRADVAPQRERDVFLDAPLLRLDETWTGVDGEKYGWNASLALMASTSYSSATSWTGRPPINQTEEDGLRKLIEGAQAHGFKTRLWSSPRWPTYVRDRVWRTLFELGTDWLDVDDIEAAAAF